MIDGYEHPNPKAAEPTEIGPRRPTTADPTRLARRPVGRPLRCARPPDRLPSSINLCTSPHVRFEGYRLWRPSIDLSRRPQSSQDKRGETPHEEPEEEPNKTSRYQKRDPHGIDEMVRLGLNVFPMSRGSDKPFRNGSPLLLGNVGTRNIQNHR